MKIIHLFIAVLICFAAKSQITYSNVFTPIKWTKGGFDSLFIPQSDTLTPKDKTRSWITLKDSTLYSWTGVRWKQITGAASIDLSNYLQKQTQGPTATLTGGETRELMSSGANLTYSFDWTAGRAAATPTSQATANITSITINGVSQTFSNPSPGAIVGGTYTGTVVRNVDASFTIIVTTSDGKTAAVAIAVIFQPKRYWFYSTSATPASSNVVAALGGGSELSPSNAKSGFTITPSGGNQYLSYAYPSSEGALSSINIGGFESIVSFTQRTVSVTNASGYVQNYNVYTSNNQLPTTTINSVN